MHGTKTCPNCGSTIVGLRRCDPCRFKTHVDIPTDASGCWIWAGARNNRGYGVGQWAGRVQTAHRASYELHNGPIPAGLQVDHICHNKVCVNPTHLRLVTNKQNQENISGAQANNKVGIRGVSRNGKSGWCAAVMHNGVLHTSYHRTIEEAAESARLMRLKYHTHNDADR